MDTGSVEREPEGKIPGTANKEALSGVAEAAGTGARSGSGVLRHTGVPSQWDEEADVVVVGFGGAGAAAAIEANRAGATVLIVERMSKSGGSTLLSQGIIYLGGGTPVQEASGFVDTVENMYNYMLAAAGDGADPELTRVYCEQSVPLFHWLVQLGVKFKGSFIPGKMAYLSTEDGLYFSGNERQARFRAIAAPIPRGHHVQATRRSGQALWLPLQAGAEAASAEVLYSTRVQTLIVDVDGRVVGVAAEADGKERYLKANKGVILCTGGFGANREMVGQHCPALLRSSRHIGTPSDDGSGIRMGQAVGADVRLLSGAAGHMAPYIYDEALVKGMLVNDRGLRFIGEDNYLSFVGDAIVRRHPVAYLLADAALWNQVSARVRKFVRLAAQGATVAELATELDVPSDLLESTFDAYNQFAAQGEDPVFQKDSQYVVPLETGPFYALHFFAKSVGFFTTGGLRINASAQVLDVGGQPIEGLYAAGRSAFAVTAQYYPASGTSIGECLIFGRIAGQAAAATLS